MSDGKRRVAASPRFIAAAVVVAASVASAGVARAQILNATLDFTSDTMMINGQNVPAKPVVRFNGIILTASSRGPTKIVASRLTGAPKNSRNLL